MGGRDGYADGSSRNFRNPNSEKTKSPSAAQMERCDGPSLERILAEL